jgi:hypothetical protein
MGGIMPNGERDAAIKRLRRAAERAQDACLKYRLAIIENQVIPVADAVHQAYLCKRNELLALYRVWRCFPECERDDQVPSPEEVITRCDSYDRQREEAERIAARSA